MKNKIQVKGTWNQVAAARTVQRRQMLEQGALDGRYRQRSEPNPRAYRRKKYRYSQED
jgi:hypothetical protein